MINNSQTIFSSSDCLAEHPDWSQVAVDDYASIGEGVALIFDLINNGDLSPQVGTGNPNGIVTANYSLKYIDTSGPTEYYNPTFGENAGWVAL